MRARLLIVSALLATSAAHAQPRDSLGAAARDYVRLQLAIGEKEDGYIDAYYGPASLRAEGKAIAAKSDLDRLKQDAETLRSRVQRLPGNAARKRFLVAQLTAAVTRLRMLKGEKLSFDDEAEGLFGLRPKLKPLTYYDPLLTQIEKLVPGTGPLSERVNAFSDRFVVPAARVEAVSKAAIAECKARTARHIRLPQGEKFNLSLAKGKSWGAYNYYEGSYTSRIEINTDLPGRISQAINYGCHEGYPGHHVLNALLEQKLTRGRGWVEFSVYPLFSPQSLIAEGTADYGVNLAFPKRQKLEFEVKRLYPLAGLPTTEAARYRALLAATKDLGPATMTIAREYLDGRISEAQAVELYRKYGLINEERARKALSFAKQYRSYVINYGLGEQLVAADVESRRGTAARWQRFEQIISEPTLPSDLKPSRPGRS